MGYYSQPDPKDQAPWDSEGNLLHFPGQHKWGLTQEWRKIEPMFMRLKLVSMERGRSAARFIWEDDEGHTYPMFMSGMYTLLQEGTVSHGVTGRRMWTIKKMGQNYGIAPLKEKS